MRLHQSMAIIALALTLTVALPARSEEAVESTASATSAAAVGAPEESAAATPSEAPESAHPDCMKACLEEDEFLFDCASYCILTV